MATGELAEAFEQHLRSLSEAEWAALTERVRTPQPAPPPAAPLPGEHLDDAPRGNTAKTAVEYAREEARRRGYIVDGEPVKR